MFAGQRAEGFHVDLGSIFDLGTLRPFQSLHLIPSADAVGVNGSQGFNVHSIAIQVPISDLTRGQNRPTNVMDAGSVIGVWASASRQKSRIYDSYSGRTRGHGPFVQAYRKPRADLLAILLTGIPSGVVPGFQNYTGTTQADLLRLNVAVPPSASPKPLGLVAGDPAGFPNGRRVFDDTTTVELRAIGGSTIPLVDRTFTPDGAASLITDGTTNTNSAYLTSFPYLGTPAGGYQGTPGTPRT